MPTAFLSFAHDDQLVADQIARVLHSHGVEIFNFAAIAPGANVSQAIDEGIENSDAFIFLISQNFAKSEWANIEVAAAMAEISSGRNRLLVPVLIDKNVDPTTGVPSLLRRYQWLDLRDGIDERSLARIARSLVTQTPSSSLTEQLDAEESLLVLRQEALERERFDYALERADLEARKMRAWTTIAFVIGVLAFMLAIIPFLRSVGDSGDALSVVVGVAGAALGSAATLLFGRRSRRIEVERLRRGRPD